MLLYFDANDAAFRGVRLGFFAFEFFLRFACVLRDRVDRALLGGALLLKGQRLEGVRVQRATTGPRLRHDVPVRARDLIDK